MKTYPPISAEEVLYKCQACSHQFPYLRYWTDYGYRGLECNTCGDAYFVNTFEDLIFNLVQQQGKKQFPGHKLKAPFEEDPEIQWFEREFEKTCDPCSCGGKLRFALREDELTCRKCGSAEIEFVEVRQKLSPQELAIKWVTHKVWEEKNKGKLK